MTVAIVSIVVLVLLALAVVAVYNRLVRLRNRVDNAWAQVDVQLRRRYDLIPNLVETVKGYASHERSTFEEVTRARTAAQQATGVAQQAEAENLLTAAIGRLFAVAEAYPELRESDNFRDLNRNNFTYFNRKRVSLLTEALGTAIVDLRDSFLDDAAKGQLRDASPACLR